MSLRGVLTVARRSRSKLEHEIPRFTRNKLRNLQVSSYQLSAFSFILTVFFIFALSFCPLIFEFCFPEIATLCSQ